MSYVVSMPIKSYKLNWYTFQDAEEETTGIEDSITDLEEDKEQLAVDLHHIRKEALSWQKMVPANYISNRFHFQSMESVAVPYQ